MRLRKIISAGLVCLIAINGMADVMGALLVCFHGEGRPSVPVVTIGGDCCHDTSDSHAPACGDCTDQWQSIDAQVVRQNDPTPVLGCPADRGGAFTEWLPVARGVVLNGPNPARAPPVAKICLRIARITVLRI